ncbi:MAG: DNA-binding protein [Candidatus Thorarchaeota archaeon]
MTDDDTELAMIRRKKMAQIYAREKQAQQQRERQQKVGAEREKLLRRFLAPNALAYFENLKKKEPAIAKRIEDIVLSLIVYRGIREIFSQVDLMYIERQIKGEGPKIRVQRDGEISDFGEYVRQAIRENNGEDQPKA